ncbi:hypothetical protein SDC9_212483 [bioreactor metagenome]|uniref:Uncharacterized protein n=1 Tax=bioreactor metagenome TaxID=1076179 RepID=A0A645JMZ5_9ZZZZ
MIALGGITPETLPEIKDFGFGGAAVLGDLWNKFDACTEINYKGIVEHFRQLKEMAE